MPSTDQCNKSSTRRVVVIGVIVTLTRELSSQCGHRGQVGLDEWIHHDSNCGSLTGESAQHQNICFDLTENLAFSPRKSGVKWNIEFWFGGKVQHLLKAPYTIYTDILYIAFLRWVSGKQIKLKWNVRPADHICFHIKVSISFSIDRNLLLYLQFCFSLSTCTRLLTCIDNVLVCACVFPPVAALIYQR